MSMELTKEIDLTRLFHSASCEALNHCIEEQALRKDIPAPRDLFLPIIPPDFLFKGFSEKGLGRAHPLMPIITFGPGTYPRENVKARVPQFVVFLGSTEPNPVVEKQMVEEALRLHLTGQPSPNI